MMDAIAVHLEPMFLWLLRATVQASALVCLILLLRSALGRWLGIRERCFLWLILLTGMPLLWTPHGPIQIGDQMLRSAMKNHVSSLAGRSNRANAATAATDDFVAQGGRFAQREAETMVCQKLPWPTRWRLDAPAIRTLALIWLAGTGAFAGYIASAHIRFRRILASASPVANRKILSLLDDCKRLLGVRSDVGVLLSDAVDSPALFGYRLPRLLLPSELLVEPDSSELRHIFLHELAHLRRRDILVGHIVSFLHGLQWFNPLIALAFRRMRADRELACDALALSVLSCDEVYAYGRTIVRQLERLRATRRPPILAAITGDKARVKQRIAQIAGFDKARYRRFSLMIVLVVSLVCAGLAVQLVGSQALDRAVESAVVTWEVRARQDLPTTHHDEHANILRACIRNEVTGKFLVVEGERVICDADEPGQMGLWEVRFDETSNSAESDVYLYSVAARKYLTTDKEGNLTVSALEPEPSASWGTVPRPQGVWLISHYVEAGYMRRCDNGQVKAEFWGRDAASYWDVRLVWRVKTSDDPKSNPQWQREHIPGPD